MPGDSQDSILSTTANIIGLLTFAFSALNLWYLSTRRDSKFAANLKARKWDQFKLDLERRERYISLSEPRASDGGGEMLPEAEVAYLLPRVRERINTALSLVDTMRQQWSSLAFWMWIEENPIEIFIPTTFGGGFPVTTNYFRFSNLFIVRLYRLIREVLRGNKTPLDAIRDISKGFKVWLIDAWWSSPLGKSKLSDQYQEVSDILSEIDSHISLIQSFKILQLQSIIDRQTFGNTGMENTTQPLAPPPSPAPAPAPASPSEFDTQT